MQRLLPALVIAASIHAALLVMDTAWLIPREAKAPRTKVTTMRLVERIPAQRPLPEPRPPTPPPMVKPKQIPKPAVKPKTVQRKAQPKPVVKKKETPKPRKIPVKKSLPPEPKVVPSPPAKPQPLSPAESKANPPSIQAKKVESPPPPEPRSAPAPSTPTVATVIMATPRYNQNPPPAYPRSARKRGNEGTVVLEVFVTPDGHVGDLKILQSSSHPLLDKSALKAVKGWLFDPGRRGDRAVAMWVQVPVKFQLQ